MATAPSQRRPVAFVTLQDVLKDVRHLSGVDVTCVGNWSFAQILEHLARAIDASIDGFSFRANWLVRVLVAPLIKNRLLTRPMKPGIRLPRRANSYLPDPDTDFNSAHTPLESAVQRLATTTPTAAHPFLGRLSDREWLALHLRHAEMHLSFVVPREDDAPTEGTPQ